MKALVVGGSSGVGLSIVLNLASRDAVEEIYVLDKSVFPSEFENDKIAFSQCNLAQGDLSVLDGMKDIQALFITAGFGHLKFFQELTDVYVQDSFLVNSVAPIRIVRHYYDKMLSKDEFYCAIMVSVAGRLSSPLFSVYSATKAALSKFIEAVNVELDVQGSTNRVLEVSPGSLKGTGFTGGTTQPEQTAALAEEIVEKAINHEELFIPQYEEVFKDVIARYESDAHKYGVESYWYKRNQGRFK